MNYVATYSSGFNNHPGPKIFCRSLKEHAPGITPVLLGPDQIDGFDCRPAKLGPGSLTLGRWGAYRDFLDTISDEDYVLFADVKDVVFTRDPFPELKEAIGNAPILFLTEHQNTRDHFWCVEQEMKVARLMHREPMMEKREINGGVIFGRPPGLRLLATWLIDYASRFATGTITDQPLINYWFHRVQEDGCKMLTSKELYCHGELVAKRRWPAEVPPDASAIFHQYDRIPNWNLTYIKRYIPVNEQGNPHVIVSHYNENLNWVGKMFPSWPVTIYSKSDNPPPGAIQLPNVGFEAHTWLHHFYENYDNLAPITCCFQGNPYPHIRGEEEKILKRLYSASADDFSFYPLSGLGHGSYQRRSGYPSKQPLGPIHQTLWRNLLGYPPPHLWYSYYGGQFAVHRDRVRARPREWYAKARDMINTKLEACAIERMWQNIFLV